MPLPISITHIGPRWTLRDRHSTSNFHKNRSQIIRSSEKGLSRAINTRWKQRNIWKSLIWLYSLTIEMSFRNVGFRIKMCSKRASLRALPPLSLIFSWLACKGKRTYIPLSISNSLMKLCRLAALNRQEAWWRRLRSNWNWKEYFPAPSISLRHQLVTVRTSYSSSLKVCWTTNLTPAISL